MPKLIYRGQILGKGGSPSKYLEEAAINGSGDLEIKKNTGETLTFSGSGGTSGPDWGEI